MVSTQKKSFVQLKIGNSFPCFIIAEIGQNHQGNFQNAKELILSAKKSSLIDRFTKRALDEPYKNKNSFGSTYGEHRSYLEFSEDEFRELQKFANQNDIIFASSSMDVPSSDFLMGLDLPFIKIGSGDTNNFILIENIAKNYYPIILSTGMQNMKTIEEAVKLINTYHSEIVLLHCVSCYPTEPIDANLALIDYYKKVFPDITIGYSGHERGINISIAAVAIGAKVVERHFTLDKCQKGTDHSCSLDPKEMTQLVDGIREIEKARGNPIKEILTCEEACLKKLGKSIVAACDLEPSTILQTKHLAVKVSRPNGVKPENLPKIIGKRIITKIKCDEPILENNFA